MIRARLNPAPPPEIQPKPVVGVLLPLPLAGAYDYKLPPGVNAPRGALRIAADGLARRVVGLADDANVSSAVVRGLVQAGALIPTELPEFAPFPQPDAGFAAPSLNGDQAAAAGALREAVGAEKFSAH